MSRYDILLKQQQTPDSAGPRKERPPASGKSEVAPLPETEPPVTEDQLVGNSSLPTSQAPPEVAIQPADQPVSSPVSQPARQPARRPALKIVEKSFYITERLHKKIDEAVRYYQDVHGIRKADRSTIVNALLDNEANWTDEVLDLLADKVISQLTSKLAS